jgi:hypothetical protein
LVDPVDGAAIESRRPAGLETAQTEPSSCRITKTSGAVSSKRPRSLPRDRSDRTVKLQDHEDVRLRLVEEATAAGLETVQTEP